MISSSQATHALVRRALLSERRDVARASGARYCEHCGAQVEGKGAWGHDDDCPNK